MKKKLSRRDWLIRVGGLGALGAVAGKLLISSGTRPSTSLCSHCGIVPWCDLPEAAAARRRGRLRVDEADARAGRPLCDRKGPGSEGRRDA